MLWWILEWVCGAMTSGLRLIAGVPSAPVWHDAALPSSECQSVTVPKYHCTLWEPQVSQPRAPVACAGASAQRGTTLTVPISSSSSSGLLGNPPVFSLLVTSCSTNQSRQLPGCWAFSPGGEGNYYGDVLCFSDALVHGYWVALLIFSIHLKMIWGVDSLNGSDASSLSLCRGWPRCCFTVTGLGDAAFHTAYSLVPNIRDLCHQYPDEVESVL